MERKDIKYSALCEALRRLNPQLTGVHVLTFAVGYLGRVDTPTLKSHLEVLGISDDLEKFTKRYGGAKLERARDLFEQVLEKCPAENAKVQLE